jgi:hypothetical protein
MRTPLAFLALIFALTACDAGQGVLGAPPDDDDVVDDDDAVDDDDTADDDDNVASPEVLPPGSVWSYWDEDDEPAGDWREPAFDDSGWETGAAPLGYGDSPTTTIDYGDEAWDKNPTALFRRSFLVDPELLGWPGTVSIRVDDGAVVYINGVELFRRNMPAGGVDWDTWAVAPIGGSDETEWNDYELQHTLLMPGENVVAAEVHQATPDSSDLVFDLSIELLVE